ncbi:NAD(P)-dependent oxidoreductase [Spongiactinospora sp. TRM90649]|uniref:NAD(P)-dependent oxidoreductase n=1 Tax=Spongiactinospora sp. TRM90649 TaxID=3031114 RepID=UPI0023F8F2DC|nr:NAD(P)-dependent oxidoreductase [Spongiactinospora sp. TRM90649]MDF5753238.1 NAD(P)-dependent oxidoreductase [Spongiactinospora sp. TRM90649]
MSEVAWIGLGAMGGRMAARLLAAGHELIVWNRTAARADPLAARGARVAATPAEAARGVATVVVMVTGPAALREVTEGPDGIAAAVSPGATVIDMSTVGPPAVADLRAVLPPEVALIDAPVLGSLNEAESGTLSVFVGGDPGPVAAALPLLGVLGTPVEAGPLGSGAAAKLVANEALLITLTALGETLALADRLGLPRDIAWRVLGLTPLGPQAERRRPAVEADDPPKLFALRNAVKDAGLITHEAGAAGRLAEAARSWLADAEAAGLGDHDYTAVIGHILASGRRAAPGSGPRPEIEPD